MALDVNKLVKNIKGAGAYKDVDMVEIMELKKQGYTYSSMAEQLGITKVTLSRKVAEYKKELLKRKGN